MAYWKIPLYKIYWDEEDVNGILETIKRGMLWAIGPNIEEFEGLVAKHVGAKYAVAFNSRTSALHAILSRACQRKSKGFKKTKKLRNTSTQ